MKTNTKAINWNEIEDYTDLDVWNKLTKNFWLDTKVPLSNDIKSFAGLNEHEKTAILKVFAGLTQLDTIQGHIGADSISEYAITPHEIAVMKQIGFMEEVHAKSYSSVFSTLFGTEDIDGAFAWVENNKATQVKKLVFDEAYDLRDYNDRRVEYYGAIIRASSVLLESFLFYTGFYLPLHFASQGKLTNTADLIRLIMRDEGVHGYYLGYKFQKVMEGALRYERDAVQEKVTNLACRLFVNEIPLIEEIYEPLGLSAQVQTFLRYNLNKAMQNLGLENVFPAEMTRVEPRILSQLSVDSEETHDFFSGSGSSYVIGQAEETTDDDWS